MEKVQISLMDKFFHIMKINPLLPDVHQESVKKSLKRKNKTSIEDQFDYLFKVIEENEKLSKLLSKKHKEFLLKILEESLCENIVDYKLNENERSFFYLVSFSLVLSMLSFEMSRKCKKYTKEKFIEELKNRFIQNYIIKLLSIDKFRIGEIFEWLEKETSFSKSNFTTDRSNIGDWEKGENAITPKSLFKLKEDLEKDKLKNTKDYIEDFIFSLYLESCRVRVYNELKEIEGSQELLKDFFRFRDLIIEIDFNEFKNINKNFDINIFENKFSDIQKKIISYLSPSMLQSILNLDEPYKHSPNSIANKTLLLNEIPEEELKTILFDSGIFENIVFNLANVENILKISSFILPYLSPQIKKEDFIKLVNEFENLENK
ncbi:MAG: hypothetical protein KGV57_01835 [Fusobacterium sp.]|nr:hypothetical protein [Fusobacterium sp.]